MVVYRIAMHKASPASAVEVLCGMSGDDVVDASSLLDAIDREAKR